MTRLVERAVIPAAGIGNRLKPITTSVPKEMFPIGRFPAVEWVAAEAYASGCKKIAVVISPAKREIEEYFLRRSSDLPDQCEISFLIQEEPRGLGDAILLAREFCEEQPFAVLLPDDLICAARPVMQQMKEVFERTGETIFAVVEPSSAHIAPFNGLRLRIMGHRLYALEAVLPRSLRDSSCSSLTGVGRYLFRSNFFDCASSMMANLSARELDDGAIFQSMIAAGEQIFCFQMSGLRYDISTVDGYAAAVQCLSRKEPAW